MTRLFAGFTLSFLVHFALFLPLGMNLNPKPFQVENYPSSLEIMLVSSRSANEEVSERTGHIIPLGEAILSDEKPSEGKEKVEKESGQKSPFPLESNPMAGAETETEMKPAVVKNPAPIYPEIARRQGYEGLVELRVHVLKSGSVGKIEVLRSSGYDILDHAAREALRKWLFMPAIKGGRSVKSNVVVPIKFQLKEMGESLMDIPDSNQ